jgi:hypothetical protein
VLFARVLFYALRARALSAAGGGAGGCALQISYDGTAGSTRPLRLKELVIEATEFKHCKR